MAAPLQLIEVTDEPAFMPRIAELRAEAWRPHITMDNQFTAEWTDSFDPVARHWVILDNDILAASARLSVHQRWEEVPDSEVYGGLFKSALPSPVASMNRLVVSPRYRGRGLSTRLDHVRLDAARRAGCRCVLGHTHAGDKRLTQLESEGFRVLGTAKPNEHGFLKGLTGVVIYLDSLKDP